MLPTAAPMFKPFNLITEADERHAYFRTSDLQPVTLADHYADAEMITLSDSAPATVRAIFDRARNGYLYAWFDYDLGGTSELLAFGALEQGLKAYFNLGSDDSSGLARLYERAVEAKVFPADPPNVNISTAKLIASVRNNWAHGCDYVHDPNMVLRILGLCAERINALFPAQGC